MSGGPRKLVHGVHVYRTEIPIRWGDMDAMGHVNNAVYFRYLEQLRIEWFDKMGFGSRAGHQTGPVVVNAHCAFLKELRYPGTVQADLYIGDIGRSSFETTATLTRTDDAGETYSEGGAKVVWIDYGTRRSTPLSDEEREALQRPLAKN